MWVQQKVRLVVIRPQIERSDIQRSEQSRLEFIDTETDARSEAEDTDNEDGHKHIEECRQSEIDNREKQVVDDAALVAVRSDNLKF